MPEVIDMSDEMIVTLGGFAVMVIAIIKPVINLNTSITELKASIDSFSKMVEELKTRITEHGKEIDEVRLTLENHEVRIRSLEEK